MPLPLPPLAHWSRSWSKSASGRFVRPAKCAQGRVPAEHPAQMLVALSCVAQNRRSMPGLYFDQVQHIRTTLGTTFTGRGALVGADASRTAASAQDNEAPRTHRRRRKVP